MTNNLGLPAYTGVVGGYFLSKNDTGNACIYHNRMLTYQWSQVGTPVYADVGVPY